MHCKTIRNLIQWSFRAREGKIRFEIMQNEVKIFRRLTKLQPTFDRSILKVPVTCRT